MPIHKHLPVSCIAEYRALLLELTINYLIKQPVDYIDFALDFFIEKRKQRSEPKYSPDFYINPLNEKIEDERRELIFAGSILEGDEGVQRVMAQKGSTRNSLFKNLKTYFLFEGLWSDQVNRIMDAMEPSSVEKGDILIKQGEEGYYVYAVEKGFFQKTVEHGGKVTVTKTFGDSGCFGGVSLVYGGLSPFSVQATTAGHVWVVTRQAFRRATEEAATRRRQLIRSSAARIPFLSRLDAEECEAFADNQSERVFGAGHKIYGQGDLGDGMYLVLSGEVSHVRRDTTGKVVKENTLVAGDCFGTKSTIASVPRLTSCIAITDVSTAFLHAEKYERLFEPSLIKMKDIIDKFTEHMIEVKENADLIEIPGDLFLSIKKEECRITESE